MKSSAGRDYTYLEKDYEFNKEFVNNRIIRLKKYFQDWKPKNILELGCGNGRFASELAKLFSVQVHGVEISDSGLRTAKYHGIVAKKGDLNSKIPYGDDTFDLVISDQLIEHILKTDILLSESRRVLKKNGRMVIVTPNLSFWFNRFLFLFGEYPMFLEVSDTSKAYGTRFLNRFMNEHEAMGHVRVFNLPALVDMVTSSGFTVEKCFGLPLSWNLPPWIKFVYDMVDNIASLNPNLARDIGIIAIKK